MVCSAVSSFSNNLRVTILLILKLHITFAYYHLLSCGSSCVLVDCFTEISVFCHSVMREEMVGKPFYTCCLKIHNYFKLSNNNNNHRVRFLMRECYTATGKDEL